MDWLDGKLLSQRLAQQGWLVNSGWTESRSETVGGITLERGHARGQFSLDAAEAHRIEVRFKFLELVDGRPEGPAELAEVLRAIADCIDPAWHMPSYAPERTQFDD
jgi:hypothetical protein